ncbi:uncharacterized protein TNCV_2821331 [Trichonephila clavipes]|uniref:Uncharacterized protein n=1 Tax=Trichonephila clavipes TaxID=2585209 RepID=A0A8X6WG58_TRICX|nr:uncharacterized protein TNCV_2821331 [Trichonephila clavipes]
MSQINNYKNALPAGRLIPIVLNYQNEIVTLDLLGPYPVSRVRIYRHRQCDETDIRAGSSDNNNLRDESSGFDRVQRRSNESQYRKKKGSDVKRELQEKGLSFKNDQGERHTNKTNKRGPLIRSIPSSWSEKSRRIKRSKNEIIGYKRSRESGSSGPEKKIRKFWKNSDYGVPKRALSSNDSIVL